jgi:hypothetical protein
MRRARGGRERVAVDVAPQLVDREKAMFERIGVAKTWESAEREAILKIQRPGNAPALPGLEYGNGIHSICVI